MITFKREMFAEYFRAVGKATWRIKKTKNMKRAAFTLLLLIALVPVSQRRRPILGTFLRTLGIQNSHLRYRMATVGNWNVWSEMLMSTREDRVG